MHSSPIENIRGLLQSTDLPEEVKSNLLREVHVLSKQLANKEFKFKRTLKDKEIITNVLNETIQQLEEKSKTLTIQAKQLEEQSEFKEKLFANVSHELRTPLHGVLGMGHLLTKTPLNIVQHGYVEVIKGSADNLLVIINDILSLSEINAGKVKIKNEPFSIKKLLAELKAMVEVRTQQKGVQLSFINQPELPEYILGDRTRVYQILLNLINNSIKFTHKGYILVSSELVMEHENEVRLQFEIKDTGIGMKKEKLANIFESFTRVHDDKGIVYEGAGLGLNIVKNLTRIMRGGIEVDSEIDKGTTFLVQIPFKIPEKSEVEKYMDSQQEATIPDHWSNLKFLMIEDNSANILYSKDIFKSWNLNLDIAPTLEDAAQFLGESYDCILSDVILPDGNGMEFITELRKNNNSINQNTPVVILTASANDRGAKLAQKVNIQSYLSKPFPPDLLIRELHKIFNIQNTTNMTHGNQNPENQNQLELNGHLEPTFLEKLSKRFKGRTNLMVEMSKIFLDQAPVMVKILEESHENGDYEAIRFEAHKFKSTVNIIGLDSLRGYAMKTEELYHDGKPEIDTHDLLRDFAIQVKLEMQNVERVIEQISTAEV